MLAALFQNKNKLVLTEQKRPSIQPDEVLVKVSACGICGTDVKILAGVSHASPPVVLGHEFCGIIEKCARSVSGLSPGDYVSIDPNIYCGHCQFCRKGKTHLCANLTALGVDVNGGFAEYCAVPASQCYLLQPETPNINAALAEPLSCALYGLQLADIQAGEHVLIIGGGLIGLIMLQLIQNSGAAQTIVSEINSKRRNHADKLGADLVINPQDKSCGEKIIEKTNGGPDKIIECAGTVTANQQALEWIKPGGRVVIFGVTDQNKTMAIAPYDIYQKNITIRGSFLNPFTFATAIGLLNNKKLDFNTLDIAPYPLDQIEVAIDHHQQQKSLKTMIVMNP